MYIYTTMTNSAIFVLFRPFSNYIPTSPHIPTNQTTHGKAHLDDCAYVFHWSDAIRTASLQLSLSGTLQQNG